MASLTQPITTYTVFEENQVLTADQLNRRMDFLDQQIRMSRSGLHGIGIVCGLALSRTGAGITLSPGNAVTSEGDLLTVASELSFTRFKPFEDADALYAPFRPDGALLGLYELTNAAADSPLAEFQARTTVPLDQVCALLYLESYLFDPDLCTGGDCDNLGREQRRNLKLLLVDRRDIGHLLSAAPPFAPLFGKLDDLVLPRIPLDGEAIDDYNALGRVYATAITTACAQLKDALAKTCSESLQPLLAGLYTGGDPVLRWQAALDTLATRAAQNHTGIQYLWDHLKDVAVAYTEFRQALWEADAVCAADPAAFAKHVVLGPLSGQPFTLEDELRHGFYPVPRPHPRDRRVEKTRFLHLRIDRLLATFALPANTEVRITPSRNSGAMLEQRALPYYYKLSGSETDGLLSRWSFSHTLRQSERSLYSYHADRYSDLPHVLAPLAYQLDGVDFFRIEGHLGLVVDEAESRLKTLINDHNLPIKVITLQIETQRPVLRPRPHIWFKDLKSLHYLHRRDITRSLGTARSFTGKVRQTIQDAADLPVKETGDDTISYKAFINDSANELQTAITDVGTHLKAGYKTFNYTNFLTSYKATVQKTATINKRVKGVTFNTAYSPFETLVNDTKFRWLDWIDRILKKREEKTKSLSIFATFLEEAPAVAHLGGVAPGGTFILVYSAQTERVVADFSLPYWYYDLPADDEAEEEPLDVVDKNDWLDLNILEIRPSKELVLEKNIESLSKNINDLKTDLRLQADNLSIYSSSTSKIVDTIFKTQTGKTDTDIVAGTYRDPETGAKAALLESQARFIEMVEAKGDKATAQERTMKEQMEKSSGDMIKEAMARAASGDKDLAPGSDEEKFIETAKRSWAGMTNEAVKEEVSQEVETIAGAQGKKPILVNAMKNFITR